MCKIFVFEPKKERNYSKLKLLTDSLIDVLEKIRCAFEIRLFKGTYRLWGFNLIKSSQCVLDSLKIISIK